MGDHDFVIVGAGSAGCVLANRLSADPGCRVLLLEAGRDERALIKDMPAGVLKMMGNERYDWCYQSEPDPTLGGRRLQFNAGRMVGGSSAMNGMVYTRGTRGDFARWVEMGCTGWDFDSVLPYFMRAEHYDGPPHPAHGSGGPLWVSPSVQHPMAEAFIQACVQAGAQRLHDYCGGDQEGVFPVLGTIRHGRRWSTARAYLDPVRSRANLSIFTQARVLSVEMASRRATGVRVRIDGVERVFAARREVLVCAGAVGSPLLLQRSGIGATADLAAAGVTVRHHLQGVGRNLREHVAFNIGKFVNVPTYNSQATALSMAKALISYFAHGDSMLSSPVIQAMAFFRSRDGLAEPDVNLHFGPLINDFRSSKPTLHKRAGVRISANVCRPNSEGSVRISGPGADDPPIISYRLLADERDLTTLVRAARLIERIFAKPALASFVVEPYRPAPVPQSDHEWAAFIRGVAHTGYHPVGTCRMGSQSDPDAVTDDRLRVRGIKGLRVVDASSIPSSISANTNAATIMVAERAADLIQAGGTAAAA